MDHDELKKLLADQGKAFEEFKNAVNQKEAEIKKHGAAIAGTEEKVAKLNDTLADLSKKLSAVEVAFKRGGAGNDAQTEAKELEAKHAEAFNRYLRTCDDSGLKALKTEGKALVAGSDADGGYFVNPDTSGKIIKKVFETSPMRQLASVVTIGTDALEGMIDTDEVDFEWVSETGAPSAAKTPQVGKWRIPVYEGASMPKITNKMLEDSAFDVEAWLSGKIADKIARGTNAAYVNGDGAGKPKGFLAYAQGTIGATAWGKLETIKSGAAATLVDTALLDLIYALKAPYRVGANFVMNRLTQNVIRQLKDGQGRFIWQPGLEMGQPAQLCGYPITEFNDMANLGAGSYSVAFGNFKEGYTIVDRKGISVLRDPFTAKPYVVFYTRFRTGGDVTNFEAIKVLKTTATT